MQVTTHQPARPLAPFVSSFAYYTGEFGHAHERIVPTGTMQLLVNLHEDEFRTYADGSDLSVHPVHRVQGAPPSRAPTERPASSIRAANGPSSWSGSGRPAPRRSSRRRPRP